MEGGGDQTSGRGTIRTGSEGRAEACGRGEVTMWAEEGFCWKRSEAGKDVSVDVRRMFRERWRDIKNHRLQEIAYHAVASLMRGQSHVAG